MPHSPHTEPTEIPTGPLGPPIRKSEAPPPADAETWVPSKTNPLVQVNAKTGKFRTADMSSGVPTKKEPARP